MLTDDSGASISPVLSLSDDEDLLQSDRDTDSSDSDLGLPDRETVAVYVDPPQWSLSFYSVSSSDKLTHLHTFRGIYGNLFTEKEPLFAGFGLLSGSSSVSLQG
ncbi:hypothetical protein F7725_021241 [Dissostichus mawsoni]|uniref:Uncharacterized protein n=1 Tax=Dissostichus mawsoni TaxID=36200 RepID=A0A7J5YGE5_DISMA|nr:hypothetical protein F7725_021230 [Dissostichus mawsoni]KAF3848213.1 hypothetical protein F7725_021241 [Dissostichus mawsoni]